LISKPITVNQIDVWRQADFETEILEFKEAKEQFSFIDILSYCVGIANEGGGILLLGVSNKPPRPVVGTKAYPNVNKLKKDILDRLHFRVDIEAVAHPDGRVLVFQIRPRPTGHPYHLDGKYLMRSGESLVPMTTDQIQQIIEEEMSPIAKKILYMIGGIAAIAMLLLIYVSTEHLWRTEPQPSDHRTVGELAGSAKASEQQAASKTLPPSNSKSHKPLVVERVDWHDKHNWRKYLKVGMSKTQVQELFGEADKIRVYSNIEDWDYGSGNIEFYYGALNSWTEPD
jgi:hypothetical protein